MNTAADEKLAALFDAIAVLERAGWDYWICNGTLLGVIRDQRLIPWDVDIDLGVFPERFDRRAAVAAFESAGFSLYDAGEGSDYVIFSKYGIKVDINLFARRGDTYVSLWRVVKRGFVPRILSALIRRLGASRYPLKGRVDRIVYAMEGYSCPGAALAPLADLEFAGRKVRVPADPEKVLEWTYGATWRTPKRNYDWRVEGAHNATG